MNWNQLTATEQLTEIDKNSNELPQFILKHSTRCSISAMALNRIESKWKDEDMLKLTPYYLDLLNYRVVSTAIASHYGVEHQSPQVLVIFKGKCVYSATHSDIRYDALISASLDR